MSEKTVLTLIVVGVVVTLITLNRLAWYISKKHEENVQPKNDDGGCQVMNSGSMVGEWSTKKAFFVIFFAILASEATCGLIKFTFDLLMSIKNDTYERAQRYHSNQGYRW